MKKAKQKEREKMVNDARELIKHYAGPRQITLETACLECDGGIITGEWLEGNTPYTAVCSKCGATYSVEYHEEE